MKVKKVLSYVVLAFLIMMNFSFVAFASWGLQTTQTGANADDEFGEAVYISQDATHLVVGAPKYATTTGRTYVYERSGGTWSADGDIYASGWPHYRGRIIAISNESGTDAQFVVVGAPGAGASNNGYIFIYKSSGASPDSWSSSANFGGESTGYYLGTSVDISADGLYIVAGAPGEGTGGKVHVYKWGGSSWSEQQSFTSSDIAASDQFGQSVAIDSDGNTIIVGARGDDSTTGAAYIFERSSETWSQQKKLVSDDVAESDALGTSTDISGDSSYAVVGAPGETSGTGAAYVFTKGATSWAVTGSQQAKKVPAAASTGHNVGSDVALDDDGDVMVVKHNGADKAVLFTRSGSSWTESEDVFTSDVTLNPSGAPSVVQLDYTVSVDSSGSYIATGSNDTGANGTAYVYYDSPAVPEFSKYALLGAVILCFGLMYWKLPMFAGGTKVD